MALDTQWTRFAITEASWQQPELPVTHDEPLSFGTEELAFGDETLTFEGEES